jgi:sugar/nucleoside kinase (ribokinase family)
MSKKKVLFLGEINVDLMLGGLESFPIRDREISCQSFEITMGSSTAICACAYASLGGDTSFMGLAGSDAYGDFMVDGMHEFGIDTTYVARTSSVNTGVTVNLIHENSRTQVTYPGTISAFSRDEVAFDALGKFDHVHLAGLYLQHDLRPSVEEILAEARARGTSTSLDPQWDATEKWEYMEHWLPLLDYLFVNADEACSIVKSSDPEAACLELSRRTTFPVVKDGARGIIFSSENKTLRIPAIPVEVVDTTGAGDSFNAGFLYGRLDHDMTIEEALHFGVGVAGRSCTFVGGVNARSSYQDVLEFIKKGQS